MSKIDDAKATLKRLIIIKVNSHSENVSPGVAANIAKDVVDDLQEDEYKSALKEIARS